MFRISFDTKNVERKGRSWEDKLFNDYHKTLNDKEYEYKTESRALERLKFIANGYSKVSNNKDSYIQLAHKDYGRQNLAVKLWGIPQGYVRLERLLNDAKENGKIEILLKDFYDLRQNTKAFKDGKIIITYMK